MKKINGIRAPLWILRECKGIQMDEFDTGRKLKRFFNNLDIFPESEEYITMMPNHTGKEVLKISLSETTKLNFRGCSKFPKSSSKSGGMATLKFIKRSTDNIISQGLCSQRKEICFYDSPIEAIKFHQDKSELSFTSRFILKMWATSKFTTQRTKKKLTVSIPCCYTSIHNQKINSPKEAYHRMNAKRKTLTVLHIIEEEN